MKRNKHNRKDFYSITSKHKWIKEDDMKNCPECGGYDGDHDDDCEYEETPLNA
jgi:hypothetical protein